MTEDYGECPTCRKKKIYLSRAGCLVCGNKKCGQIFLQLGSKQHLVLQQQISKLMKLCEQYEDFRKKVEKTYLRD